MSNSVLSLSRRHVSQVSIALVSAALLFGCDPDEPAMTDGGVAQSDAHVVASDAGPVASDDAGPVVGDDAGPVTGDDAGPVTTEIAIAGSYNDGFADHVIGEGRWEMTGEGFSSGFELLTIDNDEEWATAHNDATNEYSGGLYSRFEWVFVGDDLFFCQAPYDAADEAAALAAARPDRSAPSESGCGGFPWSQLTLVP